MQFIFQFGEFTGVEGNKFWDYFFSFLTVTVAIAIPLTIFWLGQKRQKEKDELQMISSDNNKLIFLNFLIEDSYKITLRFNDSASKIKDSFDNNPFVLLSLDHYPDHSIDSIANGINQEDYYLACLRRLKPNDIGEVFLLYNAFYARNKSINDYYRTEFQLAINDKNKINESLVVLDRMVKQFISDNEGIGNNELCNQLNNFRKDLRVKPDFNTRLHESINNYVNPVIQIINSNGDPLQSNNILHQAYDTTTKYNTFITRMENVNESISSSQTEINSLTNKIKEVSKPLEEHVKKIKTDNT